MRTCSIPGTICHSRAGQARSSRPRKGVIRQTISFYAERDATADYQEHKQQNCVPRSTKAFRQHVEQRVARFLQEGHVFYRSYDPPIRLTQEQVASSYDTLYVATYNELRRADKVALGEKVNWLQQHRGGYGYTTPVAGIVIGETAKRVRIAVYNLRRGELEEKLVYPASLTPRANHTELDEAMEQAKRAAAPYLEALQQVIGQQDKDRRHTKR